MTTKQTGLEGFFWWFGVVEDREDPDKLGRVRVRVLNFHGTKVETPTEDLQWAFIIMPSYTAGFEKTGISPTGLMVGSTVFGFFADGAEGQMPMILGTIQGIPDKDVSKHDVTSLAREVNSINKSTLGPEPPSDYGTKYPFNRVYQSESGHVIEIDDTPSHERIHLYHTSGTYTEINKNGRTVRKVVDNDYEIVVKDRFVYIQGNLDVEIKGNVNVRIDGNVDMYVKGNVTEKIDGNYDCKVGGTYSVESGGNMKFKAPRIDLN